MTAADKAISRLSPDPWTCGSEFGFAAGAGFAGGCFGLVISVFTVGLGVGFGAGDFSGAGSGLDTTGFGVSSTTGLFVGKGCEKSDVYAGSLPLIAVFFLRGIC
ncbi:MAG: hypothetical protein ACRBBQ_15680 [Cognatishimia sp.]